MAAIAFFRFPSVSQALPVTRHLRNPDHFVVQLFSYALEKIFEPLIMLSFPLIRAQKLAHSEKPVFVVLKGKKRNNFWGNRRKFAFWKRGVYKVQGFENFSESGRL